MGEHKCVVSYCCCGCSLRSGSLAIGIVVLILTLLNAIYNLYAAISVSKNVNSTSLWVGFVLNLVIVIISCLLIQGIRTERRSFVMVWVWTMVVLITINIILCIVIMVASLNLVFGLISIVVMGVFIYLVVVVRSYGLSLTSGAGVA